MKHKFGLFAGAMLLTAMLSLSSSYGVLTLIDFENDPQGDTLSVIPFFMEELGPNPPFPGDSSIVVGFGGPTATSSLAATDDPEDAGMGTGFNLILAITNTSGKVWEELWYVADTIDSGTSISNFDGYVGTDSAPDPPNPQLTTFKIDSVGTNTPLISESMTADNIFEIGETWQFILQDFTSNVPVFQIGSIGLGDGNSEDPATFPSSGSIIGRDSSTPIPEPSRALLLLLGVISVASVRRRS